MRRTPTSHQPDEPDLLGLPPPSPGASRRGILPERIAFVERQLVGCVPHQQIERQLARKWSVTTRTIRNYIAKVYKDWNKRRAEDPRDRREQIALALGKVYRKALQADDYRACVAALDRLGRLHGVFVEQVEHRVSGAVANLHLHAAAGTSTTEAQARAGARELLAALPTEDLDALDRIYSRALAARAPVDADGALAGAGRAGEA